MRGVTASALDRLAACSAAAALPQARRTNRDARYGTALHAFLARAASADRDEALAEVPDEYREAFAQVDLDELPVGSQFAVEVGFALDLVTGEARELGRDTDRDYSGARDTEICGTCDVIGVFDGGVYAADFKTGWGEQAPARDNRQLRFYALAALKTYGGDRAIVELVRVRKGGDSFVDRATFDRFDLEIGFHSELEQIVARVRAAQEIVAAGRLPTVTEGAHCRWCSAAHACPARVALAAQLAAPRALAAPADALGFRLTRENAARARQQNALLKALVKEIDRQLDEFAWSDPIPLGEGKFYGPQQKAGKPKIDGEIAYRVVAERYGNDLAEIAAPSERKALVKTVEVVARRLKDEGKAKTLKAAKEQIIDELAAAGGYEQRPTTSLAVYKAPVCRTEGCDQEAMTAGGTCKLCAMEAEAEEFLR